MEGKHEVILEIGEWKAFKEELHRRQRSKVRLATKYLHTGDGFHINYYSIYTALDGVTIIRSSHERVLQWGVGEQAKESKASFYEAVDKMNAELEEAGIVVQAGEWKWPEQLKEKAVA